MPSFIVFEWPYLTPPKELLLIGQLGLCGPLGAPFASLETRKSRASLSLCSTVTPRITFHPRPLPDFLFSEGLQRPVSSRRSIPRSTGRRLSGRRAVERATSSRGEALVARFPGRLPPRRKRGIRIPRCQPPSGNEPLEREVCVNSGVSLVSPCFPDGAGMRPANGGLEKLLDSVTRRGNGGISREGDSRIDSREIVCTEKKTRFS